MKHLVVVLTEPTEGQQKTFNDYYENTHLDEVLESTGWKSAQRFLLTDETGAACPLPYLALYEVDTDDPKTIIPHLNATRAKRQQSDSLNRQTAGVWVFSTIGEKHV